MGEPHIEIQPQLLELRNMDLESLEVIGQQLAEQQRAVNWLIGDLARYAKARNPDTWHQIFPEWLSPGLIDRCAAVAKAYPTADDRNIDATWSIHMQNKNRPDRVAVVASHVDAGRTSDEARAARETATEAAYDGPRWLLAVDCNYFLHRFWHSGAGVEAAMGVSDWIDRTVKRLSKDFPRRPITDVACCFDSKINHRKALTSSWEDVYKPREKKDPELAQQIDILRELLDGQGYCCLSADEMEADDLMASFAAQFDGTVTLLTQDKDLRQCLSATCNQLRDVTWEEDADGEVTPHYAWYTLRPSKTAVRLMIQQERHPFWMPCLTFRHIDWLLSFEPRNLATEHNMTPAEWIEYQILWGDNVDGIKGAIGIGKKFAADLIHWFGSAAGAIEAARDGDERITPKKRQSLIEFAEKLEVTRQLVTLRTDLPLPTNTSIV